MDFSFSYLTLQLEGVAELPTKKIKQKPQLSQAEAFLYP